jgi:hypothetical protein
MNDYKDIRHIRKEKKIINLQFSDYEEKGLYLLFEDSTLLALTERDVQSARSEGRKEYAMLCIPCCPYGNSLTGTSLLIK